MNYIKRIKEIFVALLPIVLLIILMNFFGDGFDSSDLIKFFVGTLLVVVGEAFFLHGVDSSIMNMGDIVGNASNRVTKFFVLVLFGFVFGFFATLAEPDVQVLSSQAVEAGMNISKSILLFSIAFGVGIFVALGLFRIVAKVQFKYIVLVVYSIIFIMCIFIPDSFIALAFDASGATMSIVASPFLLALGAGVARNKAPTTSSREDNFGLLGIGSMGPILAVVILGLIFKVSDTTVVSQQQMNLLVEVFFEVSLSIIPIIMIFFVFQAIFIKIPKSEKIKIIIGSIITFVGLFVFLVGLQYGFLNIGKKAGELLKSLNNPLICIIVCTILGFSLAFTEPAVFVLGNEIEDITNRNLRSKLITFSIAISMAIAVMLSAIKTLFGINIIWFLGIGYALVFILLLFCPRTFTAIAFDSGGVASGPMSAAFILPLMIGLAGSENSLGGFGVISMIALLPLIVLQLLGICYQVKIKSKERKEIKRYKLLETTEDLYSNIAFMEKRYEDILKNKGENL